MKLPTAIIAMLLVAGYSSTIMAQFPTASEEHKILKKEEGKWDAAITMFMGPEGPYKPPQKSKGQETNRMVGDFWVISDFTGEFEGLKFTGHAQFGFDPGKKKYMGTWVDSFSPNVTKMTGTYDKDKKTMTYDTLGVGMDGKPQKGKQVVVYGEDSRHMTMYSAAPGSGEMIKVMEIKFTKAK